MALPLWQYNPQTPTWPLAVGQITNTCMTPNSNRSHRLQQRPPHLLQSPGPRPGYAWAQICPWSPVASWPFMLACSSTLSPPPDPPLSPAHTPFCLSPSSTSPHHVLSSKWCPTAQCQGSCLGPGGYLVEYCLPQPAVMAERFLDLETPCLDLETPGSTWYGSILGCFASPPHRPKIRSGNSDLYMSQIQALKVLAAAGL